jgi:hypothetical protein
MKTPNQYKNMLADLAIDQIQVEGLTPAQAQEHLTRLNEIHVKIKDLESSLNFDVHSIRSQFHGRLASFDRNPRRKVHSSEEHLVEDQQEGKLAPYLEIKEQVQKMLAEIEQKRSSLEQSQSKA